MLIEDYDVEVEAVPGRQEIPFPYVLDPGHALALDDVSRDRSGALVSRRPSSPHIGDEIADGSVRACPTRSARWRCSTALRTDFSLARLRHYTGTPPEHVQRYILFTNYHRYVDEFVRWACAPARRGQPLYRAVGRGRRDGRRRTPPIPSGSSPTAPGAGTRCRPIT